MRENDEKLREYLEQEEVPEQLRPENIKAMLDEKAPEGKKQDEAPFMNEKENCSEVYELKEKPAKKRSGISMAGRIAAGAAACAVIAGSYAGTAHLMKDRGKADPGSSVISAKSEKKHVDASFMNGAESYSDVYELLEKSAKKYEKERKKQDRDITLGAVFDGVSNKNMAIEESAEFTEEADMENGDAVYGTDAAQGPASTATNGLEEESTPEYSDTYDQEEGVREADIVKTDGKNIYYLRNDFKYDEEPYSSTIYSAPMLNIASVKDGVFTDSQTIDLKPQSLGDDAEYSVTVQDMYLYNDMIEIIGQVSYPTYYNGLDNYDKGGCRTFVSFYSLDGDHDLMGTYYQDGIYTDVRIAPDGYMYLVSSYSSYNFSSVESEEDIERYIPACGIDGSDCLPPEDILMPVGDPDAITLLNYTVISGIDLTTPGQFAETDTKALAGFTGSLYSSANNIYVAAGWENTEITRIAVGGGSITPEASGKIEGRVKDQFSMSEYGGYFRVASTVEKWHDDNTFVDRIFGNYTPASFERNNNLYVLDMDMNIVGSLEDFGENETIKSVSFSGNMGYVVTYRQTDPLFAIDLSDPTAPSMTDEFKINGYSTYMQQWDEGLLLGFGVNADSNGVETGVKLVMFDNSDPYDLREVGFVSIEDRGDDQWVYSDAVWERKALLIAPEKNLIGFPVTVYDYSTYENDNQCKYVFYSYENGEFVYKGEISEELDDLSMTLNRAIYIGDYVYALSGGKFISADIDTVTVTDMVEFD